MSYQPYQYRRDQYGQGTAGPAEPWSHTNNSAVTSTQHPQRQCFQRYIQHTGSSSDMNTPTGPGYQHQQGQSTHRHIRQAKPSADIVRPPGSSSRHTQGQFGLRDNRHVDPPPHAIRPPGTSVPYVHPHQMLAPPDLQYIPQPVYHYHQGQSVARAPSVYNNIDSYRNYIAPQQYNHSQYTQTNTQHPYRHTYPLYHTPPTTIIPPACQNCGAYNHLITQRPQLRSQTSRQALSEQIPNPPLPACGQSALQQPQDDPNALSTPDWPQTSPGEPQTTTTHISDMRQTAEALASTMEVADALDPLPIVRSLGLDVPVSKYFRNVDEKSYLENVATSSAWPHLRSDPMFATIPEDGRLVSFKELEWRRDCQTMVLGMEEEEYGEEEEEDIKLFPPPPPPPTVPGRHHAKHQRQKKRKRAGAHAEADAGVEDSVPRKRRR